MKRHELKTDPDIYKAIRSGDKKAEIRKDDRGFSVGDILILYPYCRSKKQRTSSDFCCVEVTHKVGGGQYGIGNGYCLLSIKPHHA